MGGVCIQPDHFPPMKYEGVALTNSRCFPKDALKDDKRLLFSPVSPHISDLICSKQRALQFVGIFFPWLDFRILVAPPTSSSKHFCVGVSLKK